MLKFRLLGLGLSALLGTAEIAMPTAAVAQTSSADSAYLNDLYSFLQGQDDITYTMATQALGSDYNIWVAQMFCETFAAGVSPENAFAIYNDAALSQAASYGMGVPDEVAYAVGLYGGAAMNLGAAHYCPQYQPRVQQALRSL